ncbi:MAG: hypothetical protein KUG77_25360 [Nannocystaceae bacterium]|nr:hypothetical protein [Nannocystaceae bacterium]
MTSQRFPKAASDLGAQLRARAHEPDDDAAMQLRARLRHRMFGRGPSSGPGVPELPAEPQMQPPSLPLPLLGWVVPAVAVVALAGMSAWLHRTRTEQKPPTSAPSQLAARAELVPVSEDEGVPPRTDQGPGLLEAAQLEPDPALRSVATAVALQATWADPASPRRLDAAVGLAKRLRESGERARALKVMRAVLDDLELRQNTGPGRARLLRSVAEVYDELARVPAAVAARAEASRLDPVNGSR